MKKGTSLIFICTTKSHTFFKLKVETISQKLTKPLISRTLSTLTSQHKNGGISRGDLRKFCMGDHWEKIFERSYLSEESR